MERLARERSNSLPIVDLLKRGGGRKERKERRRKIGKERKSLREVLR